MRRAMVREFEVLQHVWVMGRSRIRRSLDIQGSQPATHSLPTGLSVEMADTEGPQVLHGSFCM